MTTTQTSAALIAAAIKEAERSFKWTADKAGMSMSTFGRKLHGGGDFTVSEVARVGRALGVHPSDLLPDEFHLVAA
ncbi:hypothetical protein E3T43_07540 [Cryobacterium sp. Hh7]|uniref:helix-turn-helix domain-containing protein n=1 Tax=Cryobacterium sp. Hh7 TaxID=1259159 RepID=UPI00106B101F|nr:hypothetical protein E3T43_07540 [Cryobacterium sp. Hh7]